MSESYKPSRKNESGKEREASETGRAGILFVLTSKATHSHPERFSHGSFGISCMNIKA